MSGKRHVHLGRIQAQPQLTYMTRVRREEAPKASPVDFGSSAKSALDDPSNDSPLSSDATLHDSARARQRLTLQPQFSTA